MPNLDGTKAGLNGYYFPENYISMRYWDNTPGTYSEDDIKRDAFMGGSEGHKGQRFNGGVIMPNFLRFRSMTFPPKQGNGIHEKTLGAEPTISDFMGAPVSRGCFRLDDFPARFLRWYIPTGAKFFIVFDNEHYRRVPLPAGVGIRDVKPAPRGKPAPGKKRRKKT